MANIPIYQGSSSFFPGDTPFGFYDYDYEFQTDADKVARFCAVRLGWPIENVELQDLNFYAAFEQAITVYGNELYSYQLRDNYLSLEGIPTSSLNLNQSIITPTLNTYIRLSQQYAEEAGSGGNIDWYSGSIVLTSSVQNYDLNQWAIDNNITGGIEIKRVFFEGPPAISKLYRPWAGIAPGATSGYGLTSLAGYSPSNYFVLIPLSYDIANIQALEMFDQVRLSAHSFEIINNKMKIFPIPGNDEAGANLYFQYIKINDRINSTVASSPSSITNLSKAPYNNPTYSQINSIGRSWIFEYTLALCKEMLGYIRGKYGTIPIPGAEVTLNQSDLISAATNEKEALTTRLRDYFDQTSKQSLLERRAAENEARQKEILQVPMAIFIG